MSYVLSLVIIFQEMVSGGLIEQIESVLLTENQLCSVWQDRVPDVYEHGPNNMILPLDFPTRYARSC